MGFSWKRYAPMGVLMAGLASALGGCGGGGGDNGTTSSSYTLSGKVTGASGVTVAISGTKTASTKAGQFGSYSTSGMPGGHYTVTPSLAGYLFEPLCQAITITGNSAVPVDFTATPTGAATHTVSGKVTMTNGSGLGWVRILIASDSSLVTGSTFTDATGAYTFAGVPDGYYEIVLETAPLKYQFKPDIKRQFSVSGTDVTGQDFTTLPPGSGGATVQF